jgi:hypothetical protein
MHILPFDGIHRAYLNNGHTVPVSYDQSCGQYPVREVGGLGSWRDNGYEFADVEGTAIIELFAPSPEPATPELQNVPSPVVDVLEITLPESCRKCIINHPTLGTITIGG